MSKCLIDFLSGTWSPEPLMRITAFAKMGAQLKAIPAFMRDEMPKWLRWHDVNQARVEHNLKNHQSTPLLSLGSPEFLAYQEKLHRHVATIQDAASDKTRLDVASELKRMLTASLASDEFIVTDADFNASYSDLIMTYGVQLLDAVCHAEVDLLVYALNARLSGHQAMDGIGPTFGRWSVQVRAGGLFGYSHSANLLCDGQIAGLCAWGAKNHGCMISFSGQGCAALDMVELHQVLSALPGFKLTRCDVALDDFEGQAFDVDKAREWAADGLFTKKRPPSYCYIESGQLVSSALANSLGKKHGFDPSRGRSFYIGARSSGLMCRFYEKGKQAESTAHPNWQRAEVEFRNIDRVIPLDILVNPDPYFTGAYPALAPLVTAVPAPIETTKGKVWSASMNAWVKKTKASREQVLNNAAIQCGRVLNYLFNGEQLDAESIITRLTRHLEFDDIPVRLKVPQPEQIMKSDSECLYGGIVAI